ncbi:relaxase/mobilization nuclease domain-containing protein [uncultured Roseibium sp.]|uniref:relaxase/mobilization nuclease domain-containing protein n=1 Tax=uncultured Roseibium sp. TaxID=1936171 RepID=UPI00260CAFD2|nr:relaxase/mobilization nuclease domain-containing protein [uncultured Roseibium sp.]
MVPKLHAKGSSFKGAAQYLLHDKGRAESGERVAWTETRNLAIDDPDTAWRIMAATAMDQGRLKEQAGVRNTGRKSDKHVLHFTLSWHPDQEPSRKEMSQAADEAIAALGGSDRQAMIIAHDDEKHAHVHIMLNRVSPLDGRHLSSSKEKLKLSQWAQDYEERTGIYCENRIVNNAMRDGGEYVRGEKDQARHIHEAQKEAAANDNDRTQAVAEAQRRKDAALALRGRNLTRLQAAAWSKLLETHKERKAALARDLQSKVNKAKAEVREEYRPQWVKMFRDQDSERETFDELERSFFGRAGNIVKTVRLNADLIRDQKSKIISRSFRILTNASARQEYFAKAQERARATLQRQQAMKAQEAAKALKDAQAVKYEQNRAVYAKQREDLSQTQQAERARLQEAWKERTAERQAAFAAIPARQLEPKQQAPRPAHERSKYAKAFDLAKQRKTVEQDNDRKADDSDTKTDGKQGSAGGMDDIKRKAQEHLKRKRGQKQDRGEGHDI